MRRTMVGGLIAGLTLVGGHPLAAQYFGQNKVQYRTFEFKIIQTEHFEIYYYDQERVAAIDAARMAERAYARMSRVLNHKFQGRKPIIVYASHADFQQTNALAGDISEGTQGVTEFFKHRMVLPFTGSYADFEHVLQHELAHQFQYDVYSRGRIGAGVQTLIAVNPPLWFMEGMAEYLSIGPIDPHTAMWLRDAALEGDLPTIEELTYDPRVFPYRFGHAIFSYIGEKWGDEAVGAILQASAASGIEGAIKRQLGLTLEELSDQWRDAVQTTFLPQLSQHERARRIAQPVLTRRRTKGYLNLAPALTPDGRRIAFFSERNSYFVNLWLADAETGRVVRRLVKSGLSSDYESLRFINSSGSFSPDGRYFAIAAKHKDRDDLVILDTREGGEERRIRIPLNGLATPAWSPDGRQLVFTGFDGGLSDLFIVNRDGSGLRRLTNDKYADFQPAWSPDGKTIAFSTDRGAETDFDELRFGELRVALYRLESGAIELPRGLDQGKNINPTWAPDGRSIAFVSDRTGISNIFLYELEGGQLYQLTDVFTGVSGITAISPVLSWAREADRLAFAYYEEGDHSVYVIENPRSLKRAPYRGPPAPPVTSLVAAPRRDTIPAAAVSTVTPAEQPREFASVYRTNTGFRASGAAPTPAESSAAPVSVRTLLDSATLALPDSVQFTFKPYNVRFTPDYIARPTVGYERDNFGRGVFGGTAVSLSDILGNHTLVFAGAINGRLSEAQVLAVYVNQSRRLNWAAGASQDPYYFWGAPTRETVPNPVGPGNALRDNFPVRRFVIRDLFGAAHYPFNRFRRVEFGVHGVNISQATLNQYLYRDLAGFPLAFESTTEEGPSITYVQPSLSLVYDRTLFGYVGPFAGARSRFQFAPTIGDWRFSTALGDYRRYLHARPFTLAFRVLFLGRYGRDADFFPVFLGNTELIRGYTARSIINNECQGSFCPVYSQLIGSKVAAANVELRFPLTRSLVLGFLPVGLPPVEAALFYDAGVAWDESSDVRLSRRASDDPNLVRTPLRSYGASIRVNVLGFVILRFDYAKPLDRPRDKSYWTVSLGPTF